MSYSCFQVAKSQVAGLGLFVAEDVKKDSLLGEYVGEIISQEEAERRGRVYDAIGVSYTFSEIFRSLFIHSYF